MKIIEVGTGYTSIPAQMGAATEIVVEELAKCFQKQNIDYLIYDVEDENRSKTNLNIKEVKIPKFLKSTDTGLGIKHKLKRVIYSINLANSLKELVKNSNEKIAIHFHNQYNMFFFLKLLPKKYKKNVKLFYTVHSYIWNDDWRKIKDIVNKKYFQEIYCIKNANKVFVLNNVAKNNFTKYINISENKLIIIDNGVNTEIYKPQNLSMKENIFFQCGSVCDRKNQLGALKLLLNIMKNDETTKYFYAGGIIDEEYKNKIDQFVKNNNISKQVQYLGELAPGKELAKYYNQAKAFVFPSKTESFGLVIIEAMSCGIPVLINRKLNSVPKDIEDVCLIYENQKDFEKIVKDKILNDTERKKICSKVRKVIEEKYSWDAIAKRYLEKFEKE